METPSIDDSCKFYCKREENREMGGGEGGFFF